MKEITKLAEVAFSGFNDAEVILTAIAFNSGARFRADLLGSGLAERATAAAVDLVTEELKRRELVTGQVASRLLERLLNQLPKEVQSGGQEG